MFDWFKELALKGVMIDIKLDTTKLVSAANLMDAEMQLDESNSLEFLKILSLQKKLIEDIRKAISLGAFAGEIMREIDVIVHFEAKSEFSQIAIETVYKNI
jgi:hypothetical protein